MENSFKSVIDQAKSVLILLPTKPFFDQVAAGLGLFLSLRDFKDVQISCPTPMTVEFNRLVGVNKITQDLGNKNLIIRFVDYKASDIERVSYDIENSQFRLTVIPKQKLLPPTKEQVELSYSGVSADALILVGGASDTHFPAILSKELVGASIVHVGTRDITSSSGKSLLSFSRPASSVSEVVALLLKESTFKLDEDVSTNLLMGIENATSNFGDSSMTAETFVMVGELIRQGAKRTSAVMPQRANFQPFTPSSQPPFQRPFPPMGSTQLPKLQPTPVPILQDTGQGNVAKQEDEKPPQDWLQPKIFKGTSVS